MRAVANAGLIAGLSFTLNLDEFSNCIEGADPQLSTMAARYALYIVADIAR